MPIQKPKFNWQDIAIKLAPKPVQWAYKGAKFGFDNVIVPGKDIYRDKVITPLVTSYIDSPSTTTRNALTNYNMSPNAKQFWKTAGQTAMSLIGNSLKNQQSSPPFWSQMPPAQAGYNQNMVPPTDGTPDPNAGKPASSGFDLSNPVVLVGLGALAFMVLTKKGR